VYLFTRRDADKAPAVSVGFGADGVGITYSGSFGGGGK
jgi:hypothetical protein